jgi:hypothetical protein
MLVLAGCDDLPGVDGALSDAGARSNGGGPSRAQRIPTKEPTSMATRTRPNK